MYLGVSKALNSLKVPSPISRRNAAEIQSRSLSLICYGFQEQSAN